MDDNAVHQDLQPIVVVYDSWNSNTCPEAPPNDLLNTPVTDAASFQSVNP